MAPSAAQQVIDYLRYRGDSGRDAYLSPSYCAEIVAYIDQLRGINVTFAEALAGGDKIVV